MNKTTEALKLAEQEKQEPVAWGCRSETDLLVFQNEGQAKCFADKWELIVLPLYVAPVSAPKQEPVACPNLQPVINWLENGCDPKEAAKELRIYQDQMKAAPVDAKAIRARSTKE